MKNYYEVLEIREYASEEIIKAAYKALAKKYHPDNCSSEVSKKKMLEINEAYQVLSDINKKQTYDTDFRKYRTMQQEKTKEPQKESAEKDVQEEVGKNESQKPAKRFLKNFFKNVGNSIIDSMNQAQQHYQECYLKGLTMDDYQLVRKYRKETGTGKLGYARALEERGLLEKDKDGKYKPTYAMKRYL